MVTEIPPPTDPLEAILVRSRPIIEDLFRSHGLTRLEAEDLLVEALPRLESLQGVLPGAGHRLLKRLEAACRRARPSPEPPETTPPTDYGPAFQAAAAELRRRRLESEREAAESAALVEALEAEGDASDWAARLRGRRPSKELIVALLDRSRRLWKHDPPRVLALARTALDLLGEPRAQEIPEGLHADLEARAHAFVGNAHRLLQDYRLAERAFLEAQSALARGTQDPRERAQILTLNATLRRDQGLFAESLRDFQQAAAIYRWTQERDLEGRTYSLMAIAQAYAGQPELAIPLAERAAELIDPERHPELIAGIEHNMTHFLCAAGHPEEARRRLPRARRLAEVHGVENDLRLLRWIEGQIALALGEREEGERLLLGVREEFIAVDNPYDTALVSLELAAEYLDQGRNADARRLAEETLPIFQSLEVHRETLAALIAVQRAIELETATAGLVRELIESLQRARNSPAPRPEKPS